MEEVLAKADTADPLRGCHVVETDGAGGLFKRGGSERGGVRELVARQTDGAGGGRVEKHGVVRNGLVEVVVRSGERERVV